MPEHYTGEIIVFAGDYEPAGWARCDGRLLPVSQYSRLYSLIGNTFGGVSNVNFALPDLRGRIPIHRASGGGAPRLGSMGGQEKVTLSQNQVAAHIHMINATSQAATSPDPANGLPAKSAAPAYGNRVDATLNTAALAPASASAPHNNMQPYLCINFLIRLNGAYPPPQY